MVNLLNLTQIGPSITQRCVSNGALVSCQWQATEETNPVLVKGSDGAKEKTWAVRVTEYLLTPSPSLWVLLLNSSCQSFFFKSSLPSSICILQSHSIQSLCGRKPFLSIHVHTLLAQVLFTALFLESPPLTPAFLPCSCPLTLLQQR